MKFDMLNDFASLSAFRALNVLILGMNYIVHSTVKIFIILSYVAVSYMPFILFFICMCIMMLSSESWHKGSSASFMINPVVNEERMREPGHWLASELCVPFSALTLLVR